MFAWPFSCNFGNSMIVQRSESPAEVPVTFESFAAPPTEIKAESSECQIQTEILGYHLPRTAHSSLEL